MLIDGSGSKEKSSLLIALAKVGILNHPQPTIRSKIELPAEGTGMGLSEKMRDFTDTSELVVS